MISLALVALLNASPFSPAELKAASCDGKYEKLQRVMTMPEDAQRYGASSDYGWWSGTEYKGHEGLKPGYWVWVSPRWYIWAAQKPVTDPSFGHKYGDLIRTIDAPEDEARYGQAHDYGYWAGSEYRGVKRLPHAYWTYLAPRWYLWASEAPGTTPAE